jgi:hypothetical protein
MVNRTSTSPTAERSYRCSANWKSSGVCKSGQTKFRLIVAGCCRVDMVHTAYPVAHPLRLDDLGLKKRLGAILRRGTIITCLIAPSRAKSLNRGRGKALAFDGQGTRWRRSDFRRAVSDAGRR